MKRLLVGVLFAVVGLALWADCKDRSKPIEKYIKGEVLVQFKDDPGRGAAMKDLHAKEIKRLKIGSHMVEHWKVEDTEAAVAKLKKNPKVVYAEPNYTREWLEQPDALPNDPLLPKYQWMWKSPTTTCGSDTTPNAASCSQCPQPADADIDAEHAWDLTMGDASIVVGDQELEPDPTHPDTLAMRFVNPGEIAGDGIDNDNNTKIDDVYGWDFYENKPAFNAVAPPEISYHATAVWGSISGGNNGIGGTGIAPNVKVMPILPNGPTTYADVYAYAYSLGVRVINMSFGSLTFSQTFHDAICNSPILFVASAGNSAANNDDPAHMQYPAGYDCPNLITVAANTCINTIAGFSNWGTATPESSSSVDLFAPGNAVYTNAGPLSPGPCLPAGRVAYGSCALNCSGCSDGAPACTPNDNPNTAAGPVCDLMVEIGGTSFSAPTVAGVAALNLSRNPKLTAVQNKAIILDNVDTYAAFSNKCVTGGKVNAYKSVLQSTSLNLMPISDAGPNGYSATPAGLHYLNVDELTQNGDTDYLQVYSNSSEAYGFSSSDIATLPDALVIKTVTITWTVNNTSVDDAVEHVGLKVGGTDYWGANRTIQHNTGYQTFTDTFTAAQVGGTLSKTVLTSALLRHGPVSQGALPRPRLTQIYATAAGY